MVKLADMEIYSADVNMTELWSKEKAKVKTVDGAPAVCAKIEPQGAVVFEIQ